MEYARPPTISVKELNRRAKMLLETQLNQLWVEAEISNLTQASSGHWYFSLKDSQAQIRCAMFRNRNLLVKFKPKSGMKVKVRGRVSLYEPRGDYQFIADFMEQDGKGALQREFEELKAKLSVEGLFDNEHKRPLPALVSHIAVISSIDGAAVHDILNVLKRRNPSIKVTLIPSLVQGESASKTLIKGLQLADCIEDLDAIIIGRGGGSLEDLWPFNNETLARAIFTTNVPVVSAVGHEIDFSISDFVADYRAPTPSAAAEVLSSDRKVLIATTRTLHERLLSAFKNRINRKQLELSQFSKRVKHPGDKINHWQQRLDISEQRLGSAIRSKLKKQATEIEHKEKRLSVVKPSKLIAALDKQLKTNYLRLDKAIHNFVNDQKQSLAQSVSALDIVSPLATLQRGYSIARSGEGNIVKSVSQIKKGEKLALQLHDGEVLTEVSDTRPKDELSKS